MFASISLPQNTSVSAVGYVGIEFAADELNADLRVSVQIHSDGREYTSLLVHVTLWMLCQFRCRGSIMWKHVSGRRVCPNQCKKD